MFILLNTEPFNADVADVSGIPTAKTVAKLGAEIWTDRNYAISEMNNELLGATLFKPAHYRNKATMSVTANKKAAVYVALYEPPRDGGLMQVLQTDGWDLTSHELEWTNINNGSKHKLNKIWKKQVNAGSTISFTSTKDNMTFAILVKEGKYCFI